MQKNPFTDHPASVGETYSEHLVHASGFGFAMLKGGVVCLVHALLPFMFEKTGSQIITGLHDRMVANRVAAQNMARAQAYAQENGGAETKAAPARSWTANPIPF